MCICLSEQFQPEFSSTPQYMYQISQTGAQNLKPLKGDIGINSEHYPLLFNNYIDKAQRKQERMIMFDFTFLFQKKYKNCCICNISREKCQ
jgi:hypothetical protein